MEIHKNEKKRRINSREVPELNAEQEAFNQKYEEVQSNIFTLFDEVGIGKFINTYNQEIDESFSERSYTYFKDSEGKEWCLTRIGDSIPKRGDLTEVFELNLVGSHDSRIILEVDENGVFNGTSEDIKNRIKNTGFSF